MSSQVNIKDRSNKYLFFYSGQLVSLVGSSTVQFIIIWWITITTQSALNLMIASLLGVASSLLTGLVAGVIADRYDRKIIIIISDTLQALATFVLMYLFYIGIANLTHIFGLLFFRGLIGGFQRPAVQAIIPSMVPREKLSRINSLSYLSNSVINLSTPVLAAILLGIFGMENMFALLAIDGITFLLGTIPLILVKIPKTHMKKKSSTEKSKFRTEFMDGIRIIKEGPGLISLLLSFAVTNFFLTASLSFLPLVVSSDHGLGADEYVLAYGLSALQGGGILISTILMKKKLTKNLVKNLTLGICAAMIGIIVSGAGVFMGNLYLFWAGLTVVGFSIPIAGISSSVIWQSNIPAEYQGRVFTVRGTIAQMMSPLSLLIVGFILEIIPNGLSYLLLIGGSLGLIAYLYAYFFTKIRLIDGVIENRVKTETHKPKLNIAVKSTS